MDSNSPSTASRVISGRVSGNALTAFEHLLNSDPNLTVSAALGLVLEDWVRLKSGAKPAERYAVVDETRFSLALGAVAQLTRAIRGAQTALRRPRPVLPEDEASWALLIADHAKAVVSIEGHLASLYEAGKIYQVPRPDLHLLKGIARISYTWAGEAGVRCREQLFAVLKPWLGTPPPPLKHEVPTDRST